MIHIFLNLSSGFIQMIFICHGWFLVNMCYFCCISRATAIAQQSSWWLISIEPPHLLRHCNVPYKDGEVVCTFICMQLALAPIVRSISRANKLSIWLSSVHFLFDKSGINSGYKIISMLCSYVAIVKWFV